MESLKYENECLFVLDQLLLPDRKVYVAVKSVEEGWSVINKMQVRGAPAISIVGALSLAVELRSMKFDHFSDMRSFVVGKLNFLVTSRPTAVNMSKTAQNLTATLDKLFEDKKDLILVKQAFMDFIESMLSEDREINKRIGNHGAEHILAAGDNPAQSVTILTHCNTGSLATAGYGTALGVVRSLAAQQRLDRAFFTETRPYLQGARLTALELLEDKIPSTMICDSAAAALMAGARAVVSAVVVGADRVASNGDTANKIGTYQLAVLAQYHHVPFYVAAPLSSIDWQLNSGDGIVIEQRPDLEMTHMAGRRLCAEGVAVWNPAFDITPAHLITGGIITEYGVFEPSRLKQLAPVSK